MTVGTIEQTVERRIFRSREREEGERKKEGRKDPTLN